MKNMKLWHIVMCLLLCAVMLMSFTACDNQEAGEFSLDRYALTLEEGQSVQIVPSVDASSLTWVSSDESVATVNNGLVTAIKAGTVEITVKNAADNAICRVTVTEKAMNVPALSIASDEVLLVVGRTFDLQPTFALEGEKVDASEYTIEYSVDGNGLVSVENGVVKALAVGTAKVTVSVTYGDRFYQKDVAITVS